MNEFARILQPADRFLPGLLDGTYRISWTSQRIIDRDGSFVAALVPGGNLQRQLASLPTDPRSALASLSAANPQLASTLQTLQLVSSVGALASVANLGVSCVGFALVLHRLARVEGKLDVMLDKLEILQSSVQRLHAHATALSLARIRAAAECLDRAVMASTERQRRELAARARDLFQESKAFYLELWRASSPWNQVEIPVATAVEMQNRFLACAIGEIQAEFIGGDEGTHQHAVRSASRDFAEFMSIDPAVAFRSRSDDACARGPVAAAQLGARLDTEAALLLNAREISEWSAKRLAGFEEDAKLPALLAMEPHEIARATRASDPNGVSVLSPRAVTAS